MGSSGYEKKYNKSICFFKMKEKIGIGFLCLIHKADSNETIPVLITNSTFLPLSNTNPREKIEFTLNKKTILYQLMNLEKYLVMKMSIILQW